MYSEETKVLLGFEPSGLFEKVILAPWIGVPRTSPVETDEVETGVELIVRSGLLVVVVVVGASVVLGILGIFIFGIWNCAAAGWVRNETTATAATSVSDNLRIRFLSIREQDSAGKHVFVLVFLWV
jgi:hypothetical protein